MKALVTGGAGFIGSHLAEALARRGDDVVILDQVTNQQACGNLHWTRRCPRTTVICGDIRDRDCLKNALEGVDHVFHLAALPSVAGSVANPSKSNEVNLDATVRLLESCRESGIIKRVVFASSSAVYGDGPEPVKSEGLIPMPLSPYALQKLTCEEYGKLFGRLFGLSVVSLRFFNVYGPRQSCDSPYSGVIARFCASARDGLQPVIFGDGKQTRDYTYVDDVVVALIMAATAENSVVSGAVINIATGCSVSLMEVLEAVARTIDRRFDPVFKDPRVGDIMRSCADVSLAKNRLGYAAKTDLISGIAKTMEWYLGRMSSGS